jgi:hypothetical protein
MGTTLMNFQVTNITGHIIGSIKAALMMRTPKGLVLKVNEKSCYLGDKSKESAYQKIEQGDMCLPVWFLTDDEIVSIDFNSTKVLSAADKAMCLLMTEDENVALDVIRKISEHHVENVQRINRQAQKQGDIDKPVLFDQYNDMSVYGTLLAVNKIVN